MIFKDDYDFLSNFYPCKIKYIHEGIEYNFQCSEALYQALKSGNKHDLYDFQFYNGGKSKSLGRKLKIREDWEDIKPYIMYEVVKLKFEQNNHLLNRLIEINEEIVEENFWHDNYFGMCNCKKCKDKDGFNILGRILMKIRNDNLDFQK